MTNNKRNESPGFKKITAVLFFLLLSCYSFSQTDTNYTLNYNFNDHQFKEADNKLPIKPVGAYLTEDRFGNERSAAYLQGTATSYLNLGTSPLLKSKTTTISLWVRLDRRVYTGKGYDCNPILLTKSVAGDDFNVAYEIDYDGYNKRFASNSTKDSTFDTTILSREEAKFNQWYNLVITSDYDYFAFYVNGKLQEKVPKGFETKFLSTDSVIIGYSASKKNYRFSQGAFDDIQIFHRVLNDEEIKELYEAPNPNRTKIILDVLFKITLFIILILLVSYILVARRRRSLKKEQDKYELNSRLYEMEIKVIKAQMKPHFIFNSLNSIQQFIILNENEKAQHYLSKFSQLIRKLLESNTKDSISLMDEIFILNQYLELESLRFNNVFAHTIEVADNIDLSATHIPHLVVQPFVENAIWHGLLQKKGDKSLYISFKLISDKIISCTIEDNGVGRSKAKSNEDPAKSKSLAISFIIQRLSLLSKIWNQDFNLKIIDKLDDNGIPAGTKVIVTLPIIKG